jgi:Kdo2-lipid IVA lauroyltransferase/acyltransferase
MRGLGRLSFWLGSALAWLVRRLPLLRRKHVISSMRRAGLPDPERTANAMYRELGRGLFELLHVALSFRRTMRHWVELDPELVARIQALRAKNRGLVLATAHTGNWDLAACAAATELRLTVVTKRLSVRWLDRLWQRIRRRRGVALVSAGVAAPALLAALGRGETVAMLIDQAPERTRAVAEVDFLSAPAWVDLAPALIAQRARAPLALVLPYRREDGIVAVELGAVLVPPRQAGRRWAEQAMQELTSSLDGFVRRRPEQWLWLHRRWKRPGLRRARAGATRAA